MRLLMQPGDSTTQLVKGIDCAKKSVEIAIFRFDRREIENALRNAVNRGVFVHALIARTNRGGVENLRRLEMRLLEAGVTVARTSDDLVRYHGKLMIVDRRTLYLLAFNFNYQDIEHSRSFGVITGHRKIVQEAVKLFEADTKRQPYISGLPTFIVSPVNARKQLASFIKAAKKQLLIYDLKISDRVMTRLLEERAKAGVDVRIIGRITRPSKLNGRKFSGRLHTRTILRDGHQAFIGSQSLRPVELDARREVGIIFRDPKIVGRLIKTFEEDWVSAADSKGDGTGGKDGPVAKAVKKVAKAIAKDLPAVTPVLEQAVKEVVGDKAKIDLDAEKIEETVKDAVKEAVKDAVNETVKDIVSEAVEQKETKQQKGTDKQG